MHDERRGAHGSADSGVQDLWLLRAGDAAALARACAAFGGMAWSSVLARTGDPEATWAAELARTAGREARRLPALDARAPEETAAEAGARALAAVEREGGATTLAVVPRDVLEALVPAALGFVAPESSGLHVDPGHAVLLRRTAEGWCLRHANAPTPAEAGGMGLPGAAR